MVTQSNSWNHARVAVNIRLKRWFDALLPETGAQYTKFVILGHARTGTTLLHTYLNSHFNIRSLGEAPGERYRRGGGDYNISKEAFKDRNSWVKAVGFKAFYRYEGHEYFDHVHRQILGDKKIKIIHITRKDYLELYQSLLLAKKSGQWSYEGESQDDIQNLRVDPSDYLKARTSYHECVSRSRVLFRNHECLEVTYEDLMGDTQLILSDIQHFLKVPQKKLYTALQKQALHAQSARIDNLEELKQLEENLPKA